jgi:predicted Zn-dependent peptidase
VYEETKFENGLRLLTVEMPYAYSASIGVYVGVGSRYEDEVLAGASHYIEHLLFKGTERRPTPREIALSIEGVGGVLNASTGQEVTTYWAKVGRTHLPIAIDTLLDMVRYSVLDLSEIEKERWVILEEINESLDIPEDLTYRQLQGLLWPNHPLGRDIAGSPESVSGLERDMLVDYMQRHYGPDNIVIAVASAWKHQQVRDLLVPHVADWHQPAARVFVPVAPANAPQAAAISRPIEQAHFCLGVRGLHRQHPDRYALHILNAVLGEGMSSRLFVQIREKLGLAYTVYSDVNLLKDTGACIIYAGVDPEKLTAAVRAVLGEWNRLRQEPVGAEELHSAREYVKGRLLLQLEDTAANSGWVGGQAILGLPITTPETTLALLDAVTAEDVMRVAQHVLREEALVLSVVGPVDAEADWVNLLRFA